MKNFKEIAEKCLKGELSGTFVCNLFGKIIKVSSEKLSKNKIINSYELKYPDPYTFAFVRYDSDGFSIPMGYSKVINFIPDMKKNDKRIIQISLQQAREWYNSGNDTLKTLALSSFNKEEIDPYPRSWQDYLNNHPGFLLSSIAPEPMCSKVMAYTKLLLLREEWIHIWSQEQGLENDWEFNCNSDDKKYVIILKAESFGGIVVDDAVHWTYPLSFPTEELTKDFLDTFKFFLEQAKGLY